MMNRAWIVLLAAVACFSAPQTRAEDKPQAGNRFFEMRTYIANEGKLEALNARFRDHTCRLFKKHNIDIIGFWVPTDEAKSKTTLVYLLAYPSKEAREASWKAFQDDPEWKTAKAESEKNGVLVSKVIQEFMTATDYSPVK